MGIRGLCRWDVELQYYIGSKALRRPARALCGHYVPARSCAVYDSESLGLSDVSRSASHHRFLHLLTSSKGTARVDFSSVTVALVGDSSWGYPRYAGEQLIPLRCSLLPVIPVSTGEQQARAATLPPSVRSLLETPLRGLPWRADAKPRDHE